MQAPKAAIIGAAVLIVAVIAGLGIWMANNNKDEDKTANTSQTQNMEDAPMEEKTITGLAAGNKDLSTLVAAVTAADLATTLDDKNAEFTVFAPANSAFEKLPAGTVDTLVKPENKATLTNILTYHVVPTAVMSSSLSDGQVVKTAQGQNLTIKIMDGKVYIVDAKGGQAQVVQADVKASNGVVHVIDTVLMPTE
jgi:uncharacterized surface protein with fasciclin (FAS1) repeats